MLEVHGLTITAKDTNRVLVRDSSFSVDAGETLCLIGESGSGKTLTGKALLGMLPDGLLMAGELSFGGEVMSGYGKKEWRQVRGRRIGVIYQHPEQALHPAIPIGRQLVDLLRSHLPVTRHAAEASARAMLDKVSLKDTDRLMKSYPFQLSGGMNQRVMVAMALLLKPELLIADEPTSALDVTTQSEIIALLQGLVAEEQLSMLFITHDLLLAGELADTIAVMKQGEIVEQGTAAAVMHRPKHAYTKQLLNCRSSFRFTSEEGAYLYVGNR
ncbi:ABC transporter ATP-binding protein [Paenibacillus radicis (ex Gao et al. 2016)]|uniref:ABC transporter ATP-binding protein n=1 Tax=Paenibacillus radicis (ex Gao et al. 2016) TaxID=1737354 RepID=UPI001664C657|nr:ABC transporter ATP-binding protein [Paenibacillus radicis (ex Gao et al. 2016)]